MSCFRFTTAIVLGLALLSVGLVGAQAQPLQVVATTTIVADVAQNVGGDLVSVTSLVPPDADAHAFEPTPQDVARVAEADVVLAVGAGYEAFLSGLMENAAEVPLVIVSNGIEMYPFAAEAHHDEEEGAHADSAEHAAVEPVGILGSEGVCEDKHDHGEESDEAAHSEEQEAHEHGPCDPHVWTDPASGMIWADNIAVAFAQADPSNAETYAANAEAYKASLTEVRAEMENILSVVPEERRKLITNHEFMSYFARAFGFEVVGVVISGGTTAADVDPQELVVLIEQVRELSVPAIFAEAAANTQIIDVLASEAGVAVVTALSESLTGADGVAPTYLDYLRYNAQTVANALSASN
jgi:ABC-type Zn uptake system ZnuABC Zn-binding protein ZnuA